MTYKNESITIKWLDTTQEILSKADRLLNPQTIDLLMTLADIKEVDPDYLMELSIHEVVELVGMAQASIRNKRETAKVMPFRPKEVRNTSLQFHRADEEVEAHIEATIMPFRLKASGHYFTSP